MFLLFEGSLFKMSVLLLSDVGVENSISRPKYSIKIEGAKTILKLLL